MKLKSGLRWALWEWFVVPNLDDPTETYLTRLRILQTPLFGIYLHRMDGPDSRATLHDHPWTFRSFILRGGYIERRLHPHNMSVNEHHFVRHYNRVRAFEAHSISTLLRVPTWTLVFVGRRVRTWGYWEPRPRQAGWHWTEFNKHHHNDEYVRAMAKRGRVGADGIKRISNSEIKAFKTCRRSWWLGHVRKLKRRRYNLVGPAQLGTRVHAALEAYYQLEGQSGRAAALQSLDDQLKAESEAAPDQIDEILKEHELALIMVEGYCNWLEETGVDADLEVIEAEQVMETESPVTGVHLIGKQDLVVQKRSTGDRGFLDHKTVADLKSPIATLNLDEQARMYALMRHMLDPQGAPMRFQTWNMLKKVKQTSRAKPPFYARAEIYINDPELRSFWNRLYGEITDLVRVEEQLALGADHRVVAYPTPTRDCSWRCPFYDVCPMLDDENSDAEYLLETMYEPGDPLERYGEKIDMPEETSV